MTETMDWNDNFSGGGRVDGDQVDGDQADPNQSDDDEGIIELTDILDGAVDDDGKIDQSNSTIMSEKGMAQEDASPLSDDAIEAALLRIVEKKYAGQLDAIFVEAVEKVVKQEIEAIKKNLLKDF